MTTTKEIKAIEATVTMFVREAVAMVITDQMKAGLSPAGMETLRDTVSRLMGAFDLFNDDYDDEDFIRACGFDEPYRRNYYNDSGS